MMIRTTTFAAVATMSALAVASAPTASAEPDTPAYRTTVVDGSVVTTLQAAPGESEYANRDGLLDPQGTGVPDANLRLPQLPLKPLITGSAGGSSRR